MVMGAFYNINFTEFGITYKIMCIFVMLIHFNLLLKDSMKTLNSYNWRKNKYLCFSGKSFYDRGLLSFVFTLFFGFINTSPAMAIGKYSVDDDSVLFEEKLCAYLNTSYRAAVTQVIVEKEYVIVKGKCDKEGNYVLAEITPYDDVVQLSKSIDKIPIQKKSFTIKLTRRVNKNGVIYDRALSKWVILQRTENYEEIASHAHYPDRIIASQHRLKPVTKRVLKGVAGSNSLCMEDMDSLQIRSTTVNVIPTSQMYLQPHPNTIKYIYGGKAYYFNKDYFNYLDNLLRAYYEKNIAVAAIVLIQPAHAHLDKEIGMLMQHPNYDPATGSAFYSMPNMTNPESVNCYAAAIDFLAQRYCRDDNMYGRIHYWIMHNEVDCGLEWTNMGYQPITTYTDAYMKSLRLCYNITRQYDGNSQVLASFTHSWTYATGKNYSSKQMIDLIKMYSKVEGDFQWGLAYHSYPEDLTNPNTWEDSQALFDKNTPLITFKNLEVLNEWAFASENKYKGKKKRVIWLSENGINSRSYSDTDLQVQAAGCAYAWKKVERLKGIDAFIWHNWSDVKEEGICLGLRKYAVEPDPLGRKPVWYVYQAAGTSREEEVFKPYLIYIQIKDWDEIHVKL